VTLFDSRAGRIGGWLSDKYGPRVVLTVLSLIWALGTILTGVAWSLTSLIVFRFLLGIGEGGAFPTATRAYTYWMPVSERGFAPGITHSFARLGGAAAPSVVLAVLPRGVRLRRLRVGKALDERGQQQD
jgi:MFS family permease